MRVNESTLLLAQRTKLDALQEAARASGDLELLSLCTLALEEGPPTFDRRIGWVGGRVSEGERRTRVHVPAAWRRDTKSQTPRSRLSAIPRSRSGEAAETTWQAPSNVVLVSAAERTISLTQAVQNRLEKGDRVPHQDFYASPLFRRSLAQARTLAEEEHIHLLSARYGLIQLWGWHTRVTSDDVPLNDMSLDERQAWARRVDHELLEAYGVGPRVFVVLAGLQHVQALQQWAPDGVRWTFEAEKTA